MEALRKVSEVCEEFGENQHHFENMSPSEIRKQATFESIDYHKPYPTMYLRHLRAAYRTHHPTGRKAVPNSTSSPSKHKRRANGAPMEENDGGFTSSSAAMEDTILTSYDASSRNSSVRWMLHLLIGISVGALASFIATAVAGLEEWRTETVAHVVMSQSSKTTGYIFGLMFWIASSAILVLLGTLVVLYIEPAAGGSGIPDVIAYLNGILMPKVLNVKTFVAKAISCILSVAGGLPVGTEAPLIHLGAITGFGVTQGRSRTLGCQTNIFQSFRNHKDRRDFVTAGAAAGVSAAFGAPIGGLLFVMEEVASFWDHSSSGQIFLGSMVSFCTVAILNTIIESGASGFVSNKAAILFEVNFSIPLNITAVVPAIFLGIICGLLATIFTKLNLRVVRFRRKYLKPHFRRKLLEPMMIVIVFSTLCYFTALTGDCRPTQEPKPANTTTGLQPWQTENITRLTHFTCEEEGYYSPLATLNLGMGKSNIRHMFTRRTADEFPAATVFAFLLLYFSFALYTSGTFVSSGLVIPMLVIGASAGRLFGIGLVNLFAMENVDGRSAYNQAHSWMDPGVFAVIGAGAFFGGVSRMTISLSVIMVELSGELHYLLPVMVAITFAKTTADFLCEPLYHALLHLDSVPYLPLDVPVDVEQFTAEDVMNPEVVCFNVHEHTTALLHSLQTSTHHAFPVVSRDNAGQRFMGMVSREDIQILLTLPQLTANSNEDERRRLEAEDVDPARELPLSTRAASIKSMTWVEWMNHMTSLFFVIGSTKWHEKWSRSNAPDAAGSNSSPVSSSSPGGSIGVNDDFHLDVSKLPPVIDLSIIVNRSPWVVPPFFNLSQTYTLFRMMGLRHLVVCDGERVVGLITRKDLLLPRLHDLLRRGPSDLMDIQEMRPSAGPSPATPVAPAALPREQEPANKDVVVEQQQQQQQQQQGTPTQAINTIAVPTQQQMPNLLGDDIVVESSTHSGSNGNNTTATRSRQNSSSTPLSPDFFSSKPKKAQD